MSDAEKHAKVFRAAADGIVQSVLPSSFDIFATAVGALSRAQQDEVRAVGVEWVFVHEAMKMSNPREMYARWRLGKEARAQYFAYSGVASMFEKIVEAEQAE